MSAIWGLVSFDTSSINVNVTQMETPYKKRCKIDRYSSITLPNISMSCGIQYITSEASLELLPIHNEEQGILFNADCILDNREELIACLNASSREPDGTLMYLAYQKWGVECVKHFRGLFSMAVYDFNSATLYLASDHLSSRCLYYCRQGATIAFSTLLDSIREIYPALPLNECYLKDYLTAPGLMPNIVANETPYQDIFKLNPGTYLTITKDGIRETSYWTPSLGSTVKKLHSAEAYSNAFFELYSSCVKDAMRCRGNVGVAMSSGMDSASVGVLAALELQKSGRNLMTYTYVPYLTPTLYASKTNVLDETKDVQLIQSMYPNMVPHFLNNEGRNCLESLSDSLEIMEFPFKAYTNMPNLREIYQKSGEDGCRVLLTGQCGNSTVSHGYIDDVLYELYSGKHYLKFLRFLNHYSKTVKESRKRALRGCIRYFNYSKKQYQNKNFEYKFDNAFLREDILKDYPLKERYLSSGNGLLSRVPISRQYYRNSLYKSAIYTYMGEMETKMGLRYGIVIRDATKDMRMMEFCYHLPYEYFAWKGIPRWLIRNSFHSLLPAALLDNWMRYGVQNGDFLSRIERDLPSLLPLLRNVLHECPFPDWFHSDTIESYLESLHNRESLELQTFDNFIYIYIFHIFYQLSAH